MYKKGNRIFAEAGHVLACGSAVGLAMEAAKAEGVVERPCPVAGVRVSSTVARWGGLCIALPRPLSYAAVKQKLVKLRYSLDDQMAVVLNADPQELARMQAWRSWAAEAARAICLKAGVD